ncbi:Gfo/Idh/MocA family protein [Solirubrobacter soli]|uniref:Gfo/Idh/MocA family protein n=1 Tax=Solirubrobacter soli TaxID=363832 RepID=UPI00041AE87A|nr:Gfo/Idh/MocA family oxidoreductase [Solirubrobacter soli]
MLNVPDAVVRLGVVGGGLISQVAHLPALLGLDRLFAVVALAEPDLAARDALSRRYGIAATYANHAPMLERADLDALLVCSPNGTHARVVLDALSAGLHVLVEKPLCLDPADARDIAAQADRAGRVVQVGYMKRFDPAYERLRANLSGDLRLVASATVDPGIGERLRPSGFIAPRPRATAAYRRDTAAQVATALETDDPQHVAPFSDVFLGALIHDVNLVLGVCPGAWHVTDAAGGADAAYGAWARDDGARWTAGWYRLPAGEFSEELTVYTGDGVSRLRFPAPYLGSAPAELRVGNACWREPANAYVRQLEHFHACITAGEPCRTPAEQGARDIELLTELYRAVAT